jgi:hypothetical protein
MRSLVVTAGLVLAFAIAAPPVGEGDRSESIAIGLLRAVTSAEASHFENHGRYATLDCLVLRPGRSGPLLNPLVARLEPHAGYRFEFYHAPALDGPPARGAGRRCTAAIRSFAIIATPATRHGSRYRSFCADGRNTIYVTPAGQVPRVEGARCADTSTPLR